LIIATSGAPPPLKPALNSFRYCRITGHRRRGEIWRSWGLPPESHFPEYADATGIPPTAAEPVGCIIIQGRVRWPNTSNLLMRGGDSRRAKDRRGRWAPNQRP